LRPRPILQNVALHLELPILATATPELGTLVAHEGAGRTLAHVGIGALDLLA